ncbi:phenylalanine--tRNA ligase beta subunit-related protein, partial [Staphylococcus epidermidis]|uniref:phenylalanine--tRNA ligase beta subunit-related protein n=1 Tax=Staphylococcus epidermidis TaxID=1282 RepID=UPI0037DA0AD1
MQFHLTPNPPHPLTILPTPYQLPPLYQTKINKPHLTTNQTQQSPKDQLTIQLKNQHKLPYYTTPLLHHLTIPPSPLSIHFPLIKPPIPPINNLLDISNYLLLQYPQPLHMF